MNSSEQPTFNLTEFCTLAECHRRARGVWGPGADPELPQTWVLCGSYYTGCVLTLGIERGASRKLGKCSAARLFPQVSWWSYCQSITYL